MEQLQKNWVVVKLHGSWCVMHSKTRGIVCNVSFGLPNTEDAALYSGLCFAARLASKKAGMNPSKSCVLLSTLADGAKIEAYLNTKKSASKVV
jgi:hypothetical protein